MFEDEINASARLYDVPVSWVQAVIETESSWNPDAYRAEPKIHDASYGLMQLLYRTAQSLGYSGTTTGLYDPLTNIDLGTKLLGQLRRAYGDDFRRVYSAYNSGQPDLWERSSQVAANVARAIQNLTKWVSVEAGKIIEQSGSGETISLLVVGLLWLWWSGKRGL